jgi:arsenite methyltransferase
VAAFTPVFITDPWAVRHLPAMVHQAGFAEGRLRSHGYVQTSDPDYMLTIADRAADTLAQPAASARSWPAPLKAEARRRVAAHVFFGHVAYASLTARKPR